MSDSYEVHHELFKDFLDTTHAPEKIAEGFTWTEGPVWLNGKFYFNDIPAKKMYAWDEINDLSVVLENSEFANGNTTDLNQAMISCEHGGRRIICRNNAEDLNNISVVADQYQGKKLNSPNDVVVKSDRTVWFTDPPYGINSDIEGYLAESEIGSHNVYRVDPDGSVTCVADDFDKPNGLAFSPDESKLYIADSGAIRGASFPGIDYSLPHHIRVFDVEKNTLKNGRVFVEIEPGVPDGFRVDTEGYVWTSSADSLRCYSPSGQLMGKILFPEVVSNCCFGGPDGTDLFVTSTASVYRIRTYRKGAESLYR